jgi:hypothetical protein
MATHIAVPALDSELRIDEMGREPVKSASANFQFRDSESGISFSSSLTHSVHTKEFGIK